MTDVAEKVSYLEDLMQRLAYSQMQTSISLDRLSFEMRKFKDEMRVFKDEMGEYKDWSKKQIVTMKDDTMEILNYSDVK